MKFCLLMEQNFMNIEILSERKEKQYIAQKLSFLQWNKNHLPLYFHAHTNVHVNELVDNSCCFFEKQIQQLLYTQEYSIFYPKVNYHLIQI